MMEFEKVLDQDRPDLVVVVGDVNSILVSLLVVPKPPVPVPHVGAGLKSSDRAMPDEINRFFSDYLSMLLLSSSQTAVENLAKGGSTRGIHLVGDVMADAPAFAAELLQWHSTPLQLQRLGVAENGYPRATSHRAENTHDASPLWTILNALASLDEPILLPVYPRTGKAFEVLGDQPFGHVRFLEPVGYGDMIRMKQSARLILIDSGCAEGGLLARRPYVMLRDETEWMETVQAGWNVLIGEAEAGRLVQAVRSVMKLAAHTLLYGNHQASTRTVGLLKATP
jgi:UDP-GlcNAc3NAcA epimerase